MKLENRKLWMWLFILLSFLGLGNIGILVTDDLANDLPVKWTRHIVNELTGVWSLIPIIPILIWAFRKYNLNSKAIWPNLGLHFIIIILYGLSHSFLMYLSRIPFYHIFDLGSYSNMFGIFKYRITMELFKQFIFYWIFFGAYVFVVKLRDSQKQQILQAQLEKQLTAARLQTLKLQLNPHFLFNTLNSISSQMYESVDRADQMISTLSELLRSTFQIQQDKHKFKEEIKLIEKYIDIMESRFQDKLAISISIEPSCEKALVPVFLIQPLLENSIQHGMNKTGNLEVQVQVAKENNIVKINLSDNGPGIIKIPEKGIGWKNTIERLEKLYNQNYKFLVINKEEGGLSLILQIPYELEES